MRDAVIGVVKNCDWPYLRNYAISLSKCGFEGDKVLFVDASVDPIAIAKLKELGFILPEYAPPSELNGKQFNSWEDALAWGWFGRWRFKPVIDWLESPIGKIGEMSICTRIQKYRNIVWCDVRDVMFQTDPSEWLTANVTADVKLFGASEGGPIKDQAFNANWVKRTSPKDWEWMKEEEICCSGTFAGEAQIMLDVFKQMYQLHLDVADPAAFDQGLWNFTARMPQFKKYFRIPKMKEGFCATGWPSKASTFMPYTSDDPPTWNWQDMVVYAPDTGAPFSIVHQYDREPQWASQIRNIFQETDAPPLILIGSCEAWRHNGINQAARDTWIKDLGDSFAYRFVLGKECQNPGPDELIVDAPDGYATLPYKTKAARKWATDNGYGYTFHCGADTYVIASRFKMINYEAYDYLGYCMDDGYRLNSSRLVKFMQGGAGFWLSPKAASFIEKAEIPAWVKFGDDVWIGDVLLGGESPGLKCAHDSGYWPRRALEKQIPAHDYGDVTWKALHLSLWEGEPKYEKQWMYDAHALWGDR